MTKSKEPPAQKRETSDPRREGAEAERALGRIVTRFLPTVFVAVAVLAGVVTPSVDAGRVEVNLGPALMVLACGTLFAAIALLWASLRTLSGDAPLPAALEAAALQTQAFDAAAEQKRRVLRALKDLEAEHAIGKIDDADYAVIASRYRDEAKAVMRRMDEDLAPARAEAERLARAYVSRGPAETVEAPAQTVATPTTVVPPSEDGGRVPCAECGAANERDARFCKKCGFRFEKRAGRVDEAP